MSADEIETQAMDFLLRRMDDSWSVEDQRHLDHWLAASMAHRAAFWRLEYGDNKITRLVGDQALNERESRVHLWKGLAASLILLVGISGGYFVHEHLPSTVPSKSIEYATRFGGISEAVLPDGTRLTLNSATAVRFEESSAQRVLWIKSGEAFFSVTHDAKRPFVVHSGDQAVTVLGTKFSVEKQTNKTVVSVLEGRVRVSGPGGAVLTRGQTAVMGSSSSLVFSEDPSVLERRLSWRTGILTFSETPIREAVAQFNRYNERKVIVGDDQVGATKIGGAFNLANEDQFVHILETAYGVKVRSNEREIILSAR
ncbi:FecR family protein [Aquisediminimonas sediminicola]|uniref:FecR family protein n=1 Tax=Alteraquisediminimonas sediminicola TaxID=2676787 RepID=UPI001C8E2990|nr:FecR domain-containing protein [Aquisediminimonas sediminicola]